MKSRPATFSRSLCGFTIHSSLVNILKYNTEYCVYICRKRRISTQYKTVNQDRHFSVGKNQVPSGIREKRDDSILNFMLTSHTRGQHSTNIPTLKHRDSVPILLAQQTPHRTRLIEYTVLLFQTQRRSQHSYYTHHSNNVKDRQHR